MSFDSDVDVEFGRLNVDLDMARVEAAVTSWHAGRCRIGGGSRLAHLYAVSRLAGDYAKVFFGEEMLASRLYWTNVCAAAGFLHEAIAFGRTYEEVVAVSDEATAGIVSFLTPDFREASPKRAVLYANRLGLATPQAQLVKLADLGHDIVLVRGLIESGRGPELKTDIADWLLEAREAVVSLRAVAGVKKLKQQADQMRCAVVALDRLVRNNFEVRT